MGGEGAPYPDFETFGLHESWRSGYDWAVECGVLREFLALLDTCLNYDNSAIFGAVLEEICNPTSFEYLSAWSDSDTTAKSLYRLALAARLKPIIFIKYPPLTKAISARAHLKRDLDYYYLVALIVEWVGGIDQDQSEQDWLQVLRIWILVHALRRAEKNANVQDANLKLVATGLRLACETDHLRRQDLALLKSEPSEFFSLNRQLADKSEYYLPQLEGEKLVARRALFNAIIEVAKGHDDVISSPSGKSHSRLLSSLVPGKNEPASATLTALWFHIEDDEPATDVFVSPDDDELTDLLVSVLPEESYAHQALAARSVLMLGVEDYQYLRWSWGKPNPHELKYLESWISTLLENESKQPKALGALTRIAKTTGRSLRRVLDFQITATPGHEWGLHPSCKYLHRLPPRRDPGWLPENELQSSWVRPVAESIRINLDDDSTSVLTSLLEQYPTAEAIGHLWRWPDDPLACWRDARPRELSRLTQGMLGQVLPQQLQQDYDDAVFSRVLGSYANTGIPGNCAYASWTLPVVDAALNNRRVAPGVPAPDSPIGAGSRLDPIEALLIHALDTAARRVEQLRDAGNPIEYHNAFTAYVVVLLLAATGARPVNDPFECPTLFDLLAAFVYIDDKSSGEGRDGRLVHLVLVLLQFMRDEYPRHLRQLALNLESSDPALAESIRLLASGNANAGMPYFFFLAGDQELSWISVSESAIDLMELFDWPLPLRLFRHRLAIRLRWLGVDAEVIDGYLGHAEAGSVAHGDDSFRTWSVDTKAVTPLLEKAFAMLKPRLPATWISAVTPRQPRNPSAAKAAHPTRLFGMARRAQQREESHRAHQDQARSDINEFLAGRALTDLSQEEMNELIKVIILNDKGMPRTTARLRFGVFESMLDDILRTQGKRVRVGKRLVSLRPRPSVFKPTACGAQALREKLRLAADQVGNAEHVSRLNSFERAACAAVFLCITRGVTDMDVLKDLAHGRNVRLVSLSGKTYLEHGDKPAPDDPDACVRRFRVDHRLCRMIARRLKTAKEFEQWDDAIPVILQPVANCLVEAGRLPTAFPSLSELARVVAETTDQVNVMLLPGIMAGYLAGRVESYALGWRDWSRYELGEILKFSDELEDNHDDPAWEPPRGGAPLGRSGDTDPEKNQEKAAAFVRELAAVLEEAKADPASSDSRDQRAKLAVKLGRVIAHHNQDVSTAVLLLGQWLAAILYRPGKRGKFIAASSLIRYLTALGPRMVGHGYRLDLLAADEDEVTVYYAAILAQQGDEATDMVAGRLGDFHRWAQDHGVCDPDWSEMPKAMKGRRASPGFISETEYLASLRLIVADTNLTAEEKLWQGALLIYCYRYSLREDEALGILNDEIQVRDDGDRVVLVRDNHQRKLKTKASRRQVPLLYTLSDEEGRMLRDLDLTQTAHTGDEHRQAIFGNVRKDKALRFRIIRNVIRILKRVTGNPRTVLHHARHTGSCRAGYEVIGLNNPGLARAMARDGSPANKAGIDQELLGRTGVTRRTAWALGRHVGHAGYSTFLKSYFHFMNVWHDELMPVSDTGALGKIDGVFVLDDLPRMASLDVSLLHGERASGDVPTVASMLLFMRLIARKHAVADAASACALPYETAELANAELLTLSRKQWISATARKGGKDPDEDLAFLRRVTEPGWKKLLRLAEKLDALDRSQEKITLVPQQAKTLVGRTRQIVMWSESDFQVVRSLIDTIGLGAERYEIGVHPLCEQDGKIVKYARQYGFLKDDEGVTNARALGSAKQLDSTWDINENRVEKRCCLLLAEAESDSAPSNRYEFIVLLFAYAFSIALQPPAS
ncbi:MAG: hypothetical protein M0Z99_24730 [Betaproteobacteria bacterium]|nr:hypothetical protein [Betaproteobacteria bacterium]